MNMKKIKLKSLKKKTKLPTNQTKSAPPAHHYLQKQSSKIFNISTPNLNNTSNLKIENQREPFYSNEVKIAKDEVNSKYDFITVNGIRGEWVNKEECMNWRGPIPLDSYKINLDPSPTVIRRSVSDPGRRLSIRYLKPTRLPDAGDLIIKEEEPIPLPPAPPIIIRQQSNGSDINLKSTNKAPRFIREKPPKMPKPVPTQTITIPGKILDPPPRQIIVERLNTPQDIIIERWLSYPKQNRKVIYQPNIVEENTLKYKTQPNLIIDWISESLNKKIKFQGIEIVDPNEYASKYANELIGSDHFCGLIDDYEIPDNEILASHQNSNNQSNKFILTGDTEALNLIDKNNDDINKYLYEKF